MFNISIVDTNVNNADSELIISCTYMFICKKKRDELYEKRCFLIDSPICIT